MPNLKDTNPGVHAGDLRFVRQISRLRMLGLGLGALPVAAVLHESGARTVTWLALIAYSLFWPHVARMVAQRSRDPRAAELRNLMADSAFGGIWIAVIAFNIVPSALVTAMLCVDKLGVGGWRFLARTASLQVAACLATSALLGFPVDLHSSMTVIVACLPLLFAYPMAISSVSFHVSRQVIRQNQQLERLNRIDVLTGLPNRRHWNQTATSELARYLRTRRPAVVMLIDVDNFKEVNDNHGHLIGDEVLRCIASVLRASIREIDTPARYGGDEFAVLLTETDARGAHAVAERIRTMFLAMRSSEAAAEHCTLSIGLAEADRLLVALEDWVQRADTAMYRAKSGGRNRVEIDHTLAERRQ